MPVNVDISIHYRTESEYLYSLAELDPFVRTFDEGAGTFCPCWLSRVTGNHPAYGDAEYYGRPEVQNKGIIYMTR